MNLLNTGILLVNLGTPASPHPIDIKKYLAEFLSDPRIVRLPKWLWLPILYGLILPTRPRQKAKNYQKIWTNEGSPLLVHTKRQQKKLQDYLTHPLVNYAMRYGEPSLATKLHEFHAKNIKHVILLPLFPQYSTATVESIRDAVMRYQRQQPDMIVDFVPSYYQHPLYIQALAQSVRTHWQVIQKKNYLVFSFHGLPQSFIQQGDPYQQQCQTTAHLVAQALQLAPEEWTCTFQSRFGKAAWIKPYTTTVLSDLPATGVKEVSVICPGFPADCLETLEEIELLNRDYFIKAGGERFDYIPALNDQDVHIEMMRELLQPYLTG